VTQQDTWTAVTTGVVCQTTTALLITCIAKPMGVGQTVWRLRVAVEG